MAMRFIFKPLDSIDKNSLCQGDIIQRTPELAETLSQAHDYYGQADDYTHFVVLTQSCDLVRRSGRINAPYITLAAARPLTVVIAKFLNSNINHIDKSDIRVMKLSSRKRLEEKLERLIHNTDDGLFYIPEDGCETIPEDLCVFLHLSVALRTDHYQTILNNKIAEIDDVFRAKIGWLTGNIYSRVATPDVEEFVENSRKYKSSFYEKHTPEDDVLWLSPFQSSFLRKKVKEYLQEHNSEHVEEAAAEEIVTQIPTDADIVSNSIVDRLLKNGLLNDGKDSVRKAQNSIKNTPHFKELLNYIRR